MRLSRVSLAPLAHYPRASLGSLGSRAAVASLIQHTASTCCPCHVCRTANLPSSTSSGASLGQQMRNMAMLAPKPEKEYAFEIAASNLRFGEGVTAEVGLDFRNLGAKTVGIFTDKTVGQLDPFKVVS
jgi:hydroxyacid-oxoacid transhydrogenase